MGKTDCARCNGTGELYTPPGADSHAGRIDPCPDCNTEAQRLKRVLKEHYLYDSGGGAYVVCNCSWSHLRSLSVEQGVDAWADHILKEMGWA